MFFLPMIMSLYICGTRQSLYAGGARRFDSSSTVHAANVTGWMRPAEFCDDAPVLCVPERGYDIYQLKQVRWQLVSRPRSHTISLSIFAALSR